MGSHRSDMGEGGATDISNTPQRKGRKYSVITAHGANQAAPVKRYKGKALCIVFYSKKSLFTLGVKEFAANVDKFKNEDCVVIACTADSSWTTWSTSVGLTLMGEMAATNLERIREEAFIPDLTSYDIPSVNLVMLDERSCIRHVMSTSLEPGDAVESALRAARVIRNFNLPDPVSFRRTTAERKFEKKSFNSFKRQSFYEMKLDTESGQIKYFGEAELLSQSHVPFVESMLRGEEVR